LLRTISDHVVTVLNGDCIVFLRLEILKNRILSNGEMFRDFECLTKHNNLPIDAKLTLLNIKPSPQICRGLYATMLTTCLFQPCYIAAATKGVWYASTPAKKTQCEMYGCGGRGLTRGVHKCALHIC